MSPFKSNTLTVSRNVKKLSYKEICIELCVSNLLTLVELEAFTSLN